MYSFAQRGFIAGRGPGIHEPERSSCALNPIRSGCGKIAGS
jgi:hypothetical protein